MTTYRVIVETDGRETYLVEANSVQEAMHSWGDTTPVTSEVWTAEAISAEIVDE